MSMSLADALATGGGTYIKWADQSGNPLRMGQPLTGTVVVTQVRQKRAYQSENLDTWPNGDPKMEAVVTLQTTERDPGDPEDDGTRRFSINLWGGQKAALLAACKAAGVDEPKAGQQMTVTHTSGRGGASDPRVFTYSLGSVTGSVATALAVTAPQPAPVAAVPQPVTQPVVQQSAPAPAPVANPAQAVETAKALLGAGMSHPEVAAATGLPGTTVAALANLG